MMDEKPVAVKAYPTYSPPRSGILSYVPASWVPYGELMRIEKPTGIYLFYFPHLFGTLFVATLTDSVPPLYNLLVTNLIFLGGTVFMRGAACAWNDNMDQEYDRQVFRCRLRPIARRALSTRQGHYFTAAQTALALAFLAMLPPQTIGCAVPSIGLLILYPFAKRFTDYPQLVLGLQVGIAVFMGVTAMGCDLKDLGRDQLGALTALYLSNTCWTLVYDTTYAQQDVEDDAKAGVKSIAVHFRGSVRPFIVAAATLQVVLLVAAGILAEAGQYYFGISCGGAAMALVTMVTQVRLDEPSACMWWFKNGCWFVGGAISTGLLGEYLHTLGATEAMNSMW